jgi:hypothetical protein
MYLKHLRRPGNSGPEGSALVITLATLVLVCGILLVFFNEGTLNRKISVSSAGQYNADLVARIAMDTITGDLRTEIIAGSTVTTAGNGNLYIPTTNLTMVPARVADQGFPNLVKQSSSGSKFWSGSSYNSSVANPIRSAANNSTQTASTNGRFIKASFWNKPGLLGDPGPNVTPQLTANSPTSGSPYNPPDWVMVNRQGVVTDAGSLPAVGPGNGTLSDKSANNPSYVVGRYAYTLYNEGGLLDVNVVGFPSSLNGTTFSRERGLLPQIDLANLLSSSSINDGNASSDASALVQWRNQTTAANSSSYSNYVSTATNGFTATAPGDQAFVSRKDLINYLNSSKLIPTSALPFLGTSSLTADQPSYFPDPNRPVVSATQDNLTNPDVMSIRVQNSFLRPDGTTANVGDPLLKHHFPLSRLALFQNPSANAANIKTYFCMQQRSDGLWDYVDPDSGTVATVLPTIKTLPQVAATSGREPTFWELLQAGILTGSLGMDVVGPQGCSTVQNQNPTRQLLTLGLSIMDQYDADDTPTVLNLGGMNPLTTNPVNLFVAGVENLPYVSWIAQQHFWNTITAATSPPPVGSGYIDGYLIFALWNPHRNSSSASPGTYRIQVNGSTSITGRYAASPGYNVTSGPVVHNNTTLQFSTSSARNFSQIDILRPTDVNLSATSADQKFPFNSGSPTQVGLYLGQITVPTTPVIDYQTGLYTFGINYNKPITIVLEKLVGSNWIPYQIFPSYIGVFPNNGYLFDQVTRQMNAGTFDSKSPDAPMVIALLHSDPRTNRFGFAGGGGGPVAQMLTNNLNFITGAGAAIDFQAISSLGGSSPFSTSDFPLADYSYNQSSIPNYHDNDGVIRRGDSNPTAGELSGPTHGADSPYTYGDARPIVLNRAFTSVAEMGYAFRDDPWRTLNFSSSDSADRGLLDLFSVNEDDNANRSGVIDLNGASTEVLTAILMNAYRDPNSTDGTPLAAADAATIAQAIKTQIGPLDSPSFILQNVADIPTLTDKIAASLPDTFKYKREALVRSFADITNTRTWNLFIDVIAQSGSYASNAKTLNDFIVEGEKRYWVHLTLDRFTGKVIRMQVEPATE